MMGIHARKMSCGYEVGDGKEAVLVVASVDAPQIYRLEAEIDSIGKVDLQNPMRGVVPLFDGERLSLKAFRSDFDPPEGESPVPNMSLEVENRGGKLHYPGKEDLFGIDGNGK